ncbi:MAG: dihydroorotate dehydrogenase (quinone) [Anaerolineales bacterium]|nr:MAG: dihydroorotate dehydrogenase (quinone) [Anaerolineales bacterium]
MYPYFRALLFCLNPEAAHKLTLYAIRIAGGFKPTAAVLRAIYQLPARPVQAFGLSFSNPIGLAAGYDKDGLGWRGLACLGFGHIEIGTVTPQPQVGNPRPRLFRLPEDKALINRLGFPGLGAEFVMNQVRQPRPKNLILGLNIGKNKDTPLESAIQDYLFLLNSFFTIVDYITINVSSPNTVGLRQLQERQALDQLLTEIIVCRKGLIEKSGQTLPILVKLAPDLTDDQLDDALDVILANHIDGVIATNTTLSRQGVSSPLRSEQGGLSGKPLFEKSLAMVEKITRRTSGKLPVIGVGGISDAIGVHKMMDAGAVLVQIYTGLIYEGPGLVKRILRDL